MTLRLDTRTADFTQKFRAFLDTKREVSADVEVAVRGIVADVAARGDAALKNYTQKFDRLDLDKAGLRVAAEEIAAARGACDKTALAALALARDRIEAFHRRQMPKDDRFHVGRCLTLGIEKGAEFLGKIRGPRIQSKRHRFSLLVMTRTSSQTL